MNLIIFILVAAATVCGILVLRGARIMSGDEYRNPPGDRNALIIVDVLKDFMPTGRLPVPTGDEVIEPINSLFLGCDLSDESDILGEVEYDMVVAVCDSHPQDSEHFKKFPPHCVAGTEGADFADGLSSEYIEYIFLKGTEKKEDGFSGATPEVVNFLKEEGISEVTVVGVATEYCVKATALGFRAAGFSVQVLLEACRALSPEVENAAVHEMMAAGIEVVPRKEA
jgi:nicotinamidase/pyrazinamidase